jgi:hypothetical protein
MSKQSLAQVIGLAMLDNSFLTKLLKDPERAALAAGAKLNRQEITFLKERGTRYILENAVRSLGVDYEETPTAGGKRR